MTEIVDDLERACKVLLVNSISLSRPTRCAFFDLFPSQQKALVSLCLERQADALGPAARSVLILWAFLHGDTLDNRQAFVVAPGKQFKILSWLWLQLLQVFHEPPTETGRHLLLLLLRRIFGDREGKHQESGNIENSESWWSEETFRHLAGLCHQQSASLLLSTFHHLKVELVPDNPVPLAGFHRRVADLAFQCAFALDSRQLKAILDRIWYPVWDSLPLLSVEKRIVGHWLSCQTAWIAQKIPFECPYSVGTLVDPVDVAFLGMLFPRSKVSCESLLRRLDTISPEHELEAKGLLKRLGFRQVDFQEMTRFTESASPTLSALFDTRGWNRGSWLAQELSKKLALEKPKSAPRRQGGSSGPQEIRTKKHKARGCLTTIETNSNKTNNVQKVMQLATWVMKKKNGPDVTEPLLPSAMAMQLETVRLVELHHLGLDESMQRIVHSAVALILEVYLQTNLSNERQTKEIAKTAQTGKVDWGIHATMLQVAMDLATTPYVSLDGTVDKRDDPTKESLWRSVVVPLVSLLEQTLQQNQNVSARIQLQRRWLHGGWFRRWTQKWIASSNAGIRHRHALGYKEIATLLYGGFFSRFYASHRAVKQLDQEVQDLYWYGIKPLDDASKAKQQGSCAPLFPPWVLDSDRWPAGSGQLKGFFSRWNRAYVSVRNAMMSLIDSTQLQRVIQIFPDEIVDVIDGGLSTLDDRLLNNSQILSETGMTKEQWLARLVSQHQRNHELVGFLQSELV